MDQPVAKLAIGLIAHGQIHPGFLVHDALIVCKSIKAGLAMVGTHAAFSHTAEAHVGSGQMNDTIIDTAAAKAAPGGNFPDHLLVLRIDIQSQRLVMVVYGFNHIFDLIESQDGHQRAENFLTHHLVIPSDVIHDGRLDLQGIRIEVSTADCLIGIDQSGHTVKMLSTDDFSVMSIVQGIIAVLPLDLCLETFDQLVFDRAVAENIVGSHAGLAAVEEFTEHDSPAANSSLAL